MSKSYVCSHLLLLTQSASLLSYADGRLCAKILEHCLTKPLIQFEQHILALPACGLARPLKALLINLTIDA